MNRLFLKFLNAPILVLLVLFSMAIQTSLFSNYPLNYMQPDIVLLAVIWFGLNRKFTEGGVLTIILAYLAELHSSCPRGFFLITYILFYFTVRASSKYLVLSSAINKTYFTLVGSVFFKLIGLWILYLMGLSQNQWQHTITLLLPGSVVAGAVSIWVFQFLEWYDKKTFKDPRTEKALEDELSLDGEGY